MSLLIYACVVICCTIVSSGQGLEIEVPRAGNSYFTKPGIPVSINPDVDVSGLIWQLSIDKGRSFSKPRTDISVFGPLTYSDYLPETCQMRASGYHSFPPRTVRVLPLTSQRTSKAAELVVIQRNRKFVFVTYADSPGITVIDVASGARREVSFANTNQVVVISRDGRYSGVRDGYRDGIGEVFDISNPEKPVYAVSDSIRRMDHYAFIGDSKELVFSSGSSLKRLDSTGTNVEVERTFNKMILGIFPTADSSKFIVATEDSFFLVNVSTMSLEWGEYSPMSFATPPLLSADETLFSYEVVYGTRNYVVVRDLKKGQLLRAIDEKWNNFSVMRDADNEVGLMPPIIARTDHSRGKRSQSLGRIDNLKKESALTARWDLASDSLFVATPTSLYFIGVGLEPWHVSGETIGNFSLISGSRPNSSFGVSIGSVSSKLGVDTSFTFSLTVNDPEDLRDNDVLELELEWDAKLALPISPTPIGISDEIVRRVRIPIQHRRGESVHNGRVFVTTALGPRSSSAIIATSVYVNKVPYDFKSSNGMITLTDTCLRYPRSNDFLDGLLKYSVNWGGNEITVRSLDGSKVDRISVSDMSGNIIPTIADQIDVVTGRSTYIVPEVARGVYTVSVYLNGRRATSLVFRSKE